MAMEAWEPDFVRDVNMVQKAVVWLRLPGFPMEFWLSPTILDIAAEVGRLLATNDFTDFL